MDPETVKRTSLYDSAAGQSPTRTRPSPSHHCTTAIESIRAGDWDIEPVFVGREALFERADASLQNALRGRHASLTIAMGGAPGAGKSAFVAECASAPHRQ